MAVVVVLNSKPVQQRHIICPATLSHLMSSGRWPANPPAFAHIQLIESHSCCSRPSVGGQQAHTCPERCCWATGARQLHNGLPDWMQPRPAQAPAEQQLLSNLGGWAQPQHHQQQQQPHHGHMSAHEAFAFRPPGQPAISPHAFPPRGPEQVGGCCVSCCTICGLWGATCQWAASGMQVALRL